MNRVSEHIEYLLRREDAFVVIPDIGALFLRIVPSRYDVQKGFFLPPEVEIAFNSSIIVSDGALEASIIRREGVDFKKANEIILEFSEGIKKTLTEGGVASLGKVGSLILRDGRLNFIPLAHCFTPADFSWLEPVPSPSLLARPRWASGDDEFQIENDKIIETIESKRLLSRKNSIRKVSKIAASVSLFLVMSFVIGLILKQTAPDLQKAFVGLDITGVLSGGSSSTSLMDSNCPDSIHINNKTLKVIVKRHEDAVTIVDTVSKKLPKQPTVGQRYFYVVASLPSEKGACQFISDAGQKGERLGIVLCEGGRYRVYAAAGTTRQEVESAIALNELKEIFPEGWICRR